MLLAACATMNAEFLREKGKEAWKNNDEDQAISHYLESLKIEPKNPKALRAVGRLYYDKEDYEKAEHYLQLALKEDPKYAKAWNNLGWLYEETEKYKEMRSAFERAIEHRDKKRTYDVVGLGIAYYKLGDWSTSRLHLEEAIRISTEKAKPMRYIGRNFYHYKDYEKAEHYLQLAVKEDPKYAKAWNNLGWLYEDTEKYNEMRDAFTNAIKYRDKENYYDFKGLGIALSKTGSYEKAEKQFIKALKLDNTKVIDIQIAKIRLAISRKDYKAVETLFNQKPVLGINFDSASLKILQAPKGLIADLAGLKIDDIIERINGKKGTKELLLETLRSAKYGQTLHFQINRNGESMKRDVVLDFEHYHLKKAAPQGPSAPDTIASTASVDTKDEDFAKPSLSKSLPSPETVDKQEAEIIKDLQPPTITLTRGIQFATMARHTIRGRALDESGVAIVTVNNKDAYLDEEGNFSTEVLLKPGKNDLVVQAIDVYENLSRKSFTIERRVAPREKSRDAETITTGRYFAFLIGIDDYRSDAIEDLSQAVTDAHRVRSVLSAYSFDADNIILLENPTREAIIGTFDRLSRQITSNDNLLIFYAGHGHWDKRFHQGYWLPSNASDKNRSKWLSNSTVRDYIRGIAARHTLLISDACFSGGIFKTRGAFEDALPATKELYRLPSRKAMTSGMLSEVPDRSVFVEYLIKRLRENKSRYLASEQLFIRFKDAVINNSPLRQIPRFGEIREAGDEGGDFIFVRHPAE